MYVVLIVTHLWYVNMNVVVNAVEENVSEDGDTGPANSSTAMDQHGGVAVDAGTDLAHLR